MIAFRVVPFGHPDDAADDTVLREGTWIRKTRRFRFSISWGRGQELGPEKIEWEKGLRIMVSILEKGGAYAVKKEGVSD